MKLFAAVLAIGLMTPAFAAPQWKEFGKSPIMVTEVDMSSLNRRTHNGGLEVWARFRLKLNKEAAVKDSTKKGSYFLSEITVICKDDVVMLTRSTLYTKEGEVINTLQPLGPIQNPHNEDSFVSTFMAFVCKTTQTSKPWPHAVI